MVSRNDCLQILHNYLQTTDVELLSFKEKPISENVEGFMGAHFKLIIKYKQNGKENEKICFVKTKPNQGGIQDSMIDAVGAFKKEIFIYCNLFKQFEELGYNINIAPKTYHSIPDKTLFMEDLNEKGFDIINRKDFFKPEHLKHVLRCLAMYHAAGFAFERTKSKQIGTSFCLGKQYSEYFKEILYVQCIDNTMLTMKWWDCCLKTLDVLIDYLPEDSTYKSELRRMINSYDFGKCFVTETNISKTCCHGDLWSNNIQFKYNNNVVVDCKLVDFQVIRYFYPCFDVLLVIFTNTSRETRKKHLEELYDHYYNTLGEYLKKYGYNVEEIHPKKDFYKSIELVEVEAKMQMLLTNIISLLPKDKVTQFMKEEAGVNEVLFENDVLATKVFQTDEFYRQYVSESIYELRNSLVKKFK